MRVWRIPFSTNVERVALALGHKGLETEWVDVPRNHREAVVEVSGQPLVPVLEEDGRVIHDTTAIFEYLEERYPEPPLYPRDEARRAEAHVLMDWFNRVWKRPPNELEQALSVEERVERRIRAQTEELERSREVFEGLLAGRRYMLGDEFSVVDCAFFPFLKYGALFDPADTEPFHKILIDHLAFEGRYPRLEEWVRRVDEHPRA